MYIGCLSLITFSAIKKSDTDLLFQRDGGDLNGFGRVRNIFLLQIKKANLFIIQDLDLRGTWRIWSNISTNGVHFSTTKK